MQMVNLDIHEGRCLFGAAEAIFKGMFEAERAVTFVTGSSHSSFLPLFQFAATAPIQELLRKHGTDVSPTSSARLGVSLAMRAARIGKSAIALIPNDELDSCVPLLSKLMPLDLSAEGGLCLILEDNPAAAPSTCPRQTAGRLGLVCIEPANVSELRDAIEHAIRLGRAGACSVAIVVHSSLLRSAQTIEARPNRVISAMDLPMLKRRRRARWVEAGGVLRMARRLELNRVRSMPSPGERVPVGFVTIGSADAALQHLTHVFRLHGRVPVLHLRVLNPLDDVLLERFLARCEQAVVLEARPGHVESSIRDVVEVLRHRGASPAALWGYRIPPGGDEDARLAGVEHDLHPSTLARNLVHLLHGLRPALGITSKLAPAPPPLAHPPPPRGVAIGESAALSELRAVLADVDQRLRKGDSTDEPRQRTTLAIDGVQPNLPADRVIPVDIWRASDFCEYGAAALRQAAAQPGSAMFVIVELEAEHGQLERVVRAHTSIDLAERVVVISANFADRASLRDVLQQAATADQFSIVLVRDGPPARFSLASIEQQLSEIDRLGFEPRQWLTRPVEAVCAIRQSSLITPDGTAETIVDNAGEVGAVLEGVVPIESGGGDPLAEDGSQQEGMMRSQWTVETLSRRESRRMRVRVQPLLEQVQVLRTRPPAWIWRRETRVRLELPTPVHARQAMWRVHLAGYRGTGPGSAARVLCEAGRNMGYDVSSIHDATAIGPGRRAWAQVLFTHATAAEAKLTATIPHGEADVLLGLDGDESLRAIGPESMLRVAHPDRTFAIINDGWFDADVNHSTGADIRSCSLEPVRQVTREQCILDDFAAACRTWFYTDQVTDLAMLGAAFQKGLVPVRLDAIEQALKHLEGGGYGRSLEAFQFGRCLAVDERLLHRPRAESEVEDLHRVMRRMVLSVRRTRWRGRMKARQFRRLLELCLVTMPGLSETSPGRQARRDMVAGLYRCLEWGGMDYAAQYGRLLMDLYHADRGDKGRAITRNAVLPLAEAMLVRDQVYIACMAASPEQRRRFRLRMNVKRSRGDEVQRRYLTRLELIVLNRRFRADIRTSDWPARMAKASRAIFPNRWRGRRRDRELRQFMIDFVQRARHGCDRDYEPWSEAMQRLHHHAVENRLRTMAVAEVRMLAEPFEAPLGLTAGA